MGQGRSDRYSRLQSLHERAEHLVLDHLENRSVLSKEEVQRLVHDLEVYRVELEMQNQELQRSQRELELARDRYADLYDFAPVAYVTLDTRGWIREINLTGATLLGVERGLLVDTSHSFLYFVEALDRPRFLGCLNQCIQSQEPASEEFTLQVHGGQTVVVQVHVAPCEYSDGTRMCRMVITDISHRKHAEEELARSKVAAEEASRTKSEFLANMSHEIRTPMTSILGYSDLLLASSVSDEQRRQYVETIRRNGQVLLDLINDILDLSKIEAGKMDIERIAVSPVQIVEEVLSLMKIRAEEKRLNLAAEYKFPLPQTIHTDPVRLRQVLLNLVGNAIKFTAEGSVRVVVRVDSDKEQLARMQFAVIDSGIGIAGEMLHRVFQPLTQADNSTTRRFGGTGLGLAISQRLASILGGDISVESELDHGSTFILRIDPGSLSGIPWTASLPDSASSRPSPSTGPQASAQGRVLLVDDAPDVRYLVSILLERSGMEVEQAENGRIALEKAQASKSGGNPYDVILLDMQMPELDGQATARQLRQDGWEGAIVALTAHAMSGDAEKCLEAGCDDYLPKPVSVASLVSTVSRHLPRRGQDVMPASQSHE